MSSFNPKEVEKWALDTLDGRLWWDDLMDRVEQGRFGTRRVFSEDARDETYDTAYRDGYDDGYREGYDEGYSEGYFQGKEDSDDD